MGQLADQLWSAPQPRLLRTVMGSICNHSHELKGCRRQRDGGTAAASMPSRSGRAGMPPVTQAGLSESYPSLHWRQASATLAIRIIKLDRGVDRWLIGSPHRSV